MDATYQVVRRETGAPPKVVLTMQKETKNTAIKRARAHVKKSEPSIEPGVIFTVEKYIGPAMWEEVAIIPDEEEET